MREPATAPPSRTPRHDLAVRPIVLTAAAIGATVGLAILVGARWPVSAGLPAGGLAVSRPAGADIATPPSTLTQGQPRLQSAPQADLAAYRAEKSGALEARVDGTRAPEDRADRAPAPEAPAGSSP